MLNLEEVLGAIGLLDSHDSWHLEISWSRLVMETLAASSVWINLAIFYRFIWNLWMKMHSS